MSYREETDAAFLCIERTIYSSTLATEKVKDALYTLKRAADDSVRWSERMLLLERRIAAIRNICDGIQPEIGGPGLVSDSTVVFVALNVLEAEALVKETSSKTGSLTDRAKEARADISFAVRGRK